MKRLFAVFTAALMCLSLISCKKNAVNAGDDKAKISYYIKNKENTVYIYDGPAERYADWTFFYDYIGDVKTQRRVITSKEVFTEVLTFSDNAMTMTNGARNVKEHSDKRDWQDNSDVVLLKEPLTLGAAWTHTKTAAGSVESKVTGVDVEVTVPYGTFKALEVTTIYEKDVDVKKDYYAKDIGLIKTVSLLNDTETVSALAEVLEEQGLAEKIPIFYINAAKDGVEYDVINITYFTNADISQIYEKAARQFISDKFNIAVNENIKVNSIKAEGDGSKVTVDFNAAAIDEMNRIANKGTEELILQCAADYFGHIYNVENVMVTIDGGVYKSNQIQKNAGEAIAANFEDAAPATAD